jgi:hypothetical protein
MTLTRCGRVGSSRLPIACSRARRPLPQPAPRGRDTPTLSKVVHLLFIFGLPLGERRMNDAALGAHPPQYTTRKGEPHEEEHHLEPHGPHDALGPRPAGRRSGPDGDALERSRCDPQGLGRLTPTLVEGPRTDMVRGPSTSGASHDLVAAGPGHGRRAGGVDDDGRRARRPQHRALQLPLLGQCPVWVRGAPSGA